MQVTGVVCCCALLGPLASCFLHVDLLGRPDPALTRMAAAFGAIAVSISLLRFLDVELIGQAAFAPPRFASEGIHCAKGMSLELMEKQLAPIGLI